MPSRHERRAAACAAGLLVCLALTACAGRGPETTGASSTETGCLPSLSRVYLVEQATGAEIPAAAVPADAATPGGEPGRGFRVGLPESDFATLVVAAACLGRCEFERVSTEPGGEPAPANVVAAEDGVCRHQIGAPIRVDRRFEVTLVGPEGREAPAVVVEVLK